MLLEAAAAMNNNYIQNRGEGKKREEVVRLEAVRIQAVLSILPLFPRLMPAVNQPAAQEEQEAAF